MITLDNRAIYVYTEPVDMRKSINGLVVLLADVLAAQPQSGDVYVFTNRSHNKIKSLIWDQNGFVLYYKRLERGRFHYAKDLQATSVQVTPQQLQALFMGLDFYLLRQYGEQQANELF